MRVRVGATAGVDPRNVELSNCSTVDNALRAGGLTTRTGDQVLVNGKPVNGRHPLRDLDTVLVSSPIEGG